MISCGVQAEHTLMLVLEGFRVKLGSLSSEGPSVIPGGCYPTEGLGALNKLFSPSR